MLFMNTICWNLLPFKNMILPNEILVHVQKACELQCSSVVKAKPSPTPFSSVRYQDHTEQIFTSNS